MIVQMAEMIPKHRNPLIARYLLVTRRLLTPLFRQRLSTDRLKLGKDFVQDDSLKSVVSIQRELDRVGASFYATNVRLRIRC